MGTVSQAGHNERTTNAYSGKGYTNSIDTGNPSLFGKLGATATEDAQIRAAYARGQNIDGSAYDRNSNDAEAQYAANLKALRALTDANRLDSTDALLRKGQAEGLRNLTTRGRQSTFLTGAMGDVTSPQVGRQTLLGGPPSVSGLKKWGTP